MPSILILIITCVVILVIVQIYIIHDEQKYRKAFNALSIELSTHEFVTASTIKEIFDMFYSISLYEKDSYVITYINSTIIVNSKGIPKFTIDNRGVATLFIGSCPDGDVKQVSYQVEKGEETRLFNTWFANILDTCTDDFSYNEKAK